MAEILESTGLCILYRKHLTTHTWGIASFYGCLAAINALTGGPLRSDLYTCRKTRILVAAMLDECRRVSKGEKNNDNPSLLELLCLHTLNIYMCASLIIH